jgi:hypothetical protein
MATHRNKKGGGGGQMLTHMARDIYIRDSDKENEQEESLGITSFATYVFTHAKRPDKSFML